MRRQLFTMLAPLLVMLAGAEAGAQDHRAHQGMMGSGHDAPAMADMHVIHQLMVNHERIERSVTNLPDGIRTVTESDDPAIAGLIRQHAAGMAARLREGSDPELPMQTPIMRSLFRDRAAIRSAVEETARGVIVVQTSDDPAVVAALQQHASDVTALVRDGMAALHAAMMRGDASDGMHGGMHGGMMQGASGMHGGMMHDGSGMHGGMMHGGGGHTGAAPTASPAEQAAAATHAGHDTAFAALQARGREAMGVDQYTSTHRFDALPDGGRIELQRDVADPAGVAQIREHLQAIAAAFKAGDFSTPAFVHMQQVPGAAVMAARRDAISYTFRELPRGGELRITTQDAAARDAIHAFLAFQRDDHRTAHQ